MTPAEISILADAVEAETALDGQVALALGWRYDRYWHESSIANAGSWRDGWIAPNEDPSICPPFTTSLDALAAECGRRGLEWLVRSDGPDRYFANTHLPGVKPSFQRLMPGENPKCPPGMNWADASTPAAALCAALLRAVAAEKEATDGL